MKRISILFILFLSLAYIKDVNAQDFQTCINWDYKQYGDWCIRNNIWGIHRDGGGEQCLWANSIKSWGFDATHQDGGGDVKAYPQCWLGWSKGDGFSKTGKGQLCGKIKDYSQIDLKWKFKSPNSGRYLSLGDLYLHDEETPAGSELAKLNVMLIPFQYDRTGYLNDYQRSRIEQGWTDEGSPTLGGVKYRIFSITSPPAGQAEHAIHVIADTPTKDIVFAVDEILKWAAQNISFIDENWYLNGVQVGWEPIEGGNGFEVEDFDLTITKGSVTTPDANNAPTINSISNQSVQEGAGQQSISLSGIGDGDSGTQTVSVSASSNNTSVANNVSVSYTSGNATGTLYYTPVAEGTATITVTVTDDGGTANGGADTKQTSFDVAVASESTPTTFVPDPSKKYYIDCPSQSKRIAATGSSEDAYTTSTSTEGADVEWEFTAINGKWYIDRVAGGSLPRLRTDGTVNADMQATSSGGSWTQWEITAANTSGRYFLSLPGGPSGYTRLQVDGSGNVKMVNMNSVSDNTVEFVITEVGTSSGSVAVTGVSLNQTSITLNEGATYDLNETVSPSDATNKNVSWSTSNTSVATVNSNGVVTAVSAGSATITVKTDDGNKTASCSVTVNAPAPPSTFVPDPSKKYYIDCPSQGKRIAASGSSEDAYATSTSTTGADVEWKFTARNDYWYIDRAAGGSLPRLRTDGTVNADMQATSSGGAWTQWEIIPGNTSGRYFLSLPGASTNLNRLQVDGSGNVKMVDMNSVSDNTVEFVLTEVGATPPTPVAVTGVSLNQTSISLDEGATYDLNETVSPSDADNKNVSWSTNNANVATVNSNGVVTAVSAGSATITVTTEDGNKTASCNVTVNAVSQATTETVDNEDSRVSYVGAWSIGGNADDYNGSMHTNNSGGDYLEFTFTGTSLEIIGRTASWGQASATLTIDGTDYSISFYSSSQLWQQSIHYIDGLSNAEHTVRISQPASSGGNYLLIDAFRLNYNDKSAENFNNADALTNNVYPNPVTNGQFTLEFAKTYTGTVQILNVQGQIVYQRNLNETNRMNIMGQAFGAGIYLVKVGNQVTKLIMK